MKNSILYQKAIVLTLVGALSAFGIHGISYSQFPSTAQTRQDIAKIARVSTVILTMDNDSYGSGFFVAPDQIATSYHVIEGASSGSVSPVLQNEKYPIVGITAVDKENDLVILKVSGAQGTPLPIGDSETVDVLDTIYVAGNPSGIEGTVTTAEISNLLGGKYLLMSAPISPGSSGGPVLNERSEVIGISMGSIPGDKNQNQNLNVAVPSNYLTPLVEKSKKPGTMRPLSADGVSGSHLIWGSNFYEFSLQNQRPDQIFLGHCLVLFYGENGGLICVDAFHPSGFISSGCAIRIRRYGVSNVLDQQHYRPHPFEDASIISDSWSLFNPSTIKSLVKNYEVRILDLYTMDANSSHKKNKNLEGVNAEELIWLEDTLKTERPQYRFAVNNKRSEAVYNVKGIVIFYDKKGDPVHSRTFDIGKIPVGKAAVLDGSVLSSVKQLTKRVDIKIIDFEIAE